VPCPLQRLQPEDLDAFYAELLVNGRRNGAGGGLAPKSVRIIHGIIRKALADAHRKGTVTRNVADLADPPKVRLGGSRAMTVWSADELRAFLATIEDSEWYAPIFLAANTGMRRGEVLGLTWRNVDLDAARLTVAQQILSVGYEAGVADVKTANSRRTIDLDARTVAVLRTWRREQLEQKLSTGRRRDDGFVFTRLDGAPIHPDFFSQTWDRLMRASDLPRIRLHDLRHTHATILLKAGVPVKVVSERLGHSSPAFTMTVY
jgi:integrase